MLKVDRKEMMNEVTIKVQRDTNKRTNDVVIAAKKSFHGDLDPMTSRLWDPLVGLLHVIQRQLLGS